jgi:hypothetical protein
MYDENTDKDPEKSSFFVQSPKNPSEKMGDSH